MYLDVNNNVKTSFTMPSNEFLFLSTFGKVAFSLFHIHVEYWLFPWQGRLETMQSWRIASGLKSLDLKEINSKKPIMHDTDS